MKKTIDFDEFVNEVSRFLEPSGSPESSNELKRRVHDFCRDYKNGGYYRAEQLLNYLKTKNPAEASKRLLDLLSSDRLVQKISDCDGFSSEESYRNYNVVASLKQVTRYIRRVCELTGEILKEESDSTPDQSLAKAIVKLELYWYSKLVQWGGGDKDSHLNNFLLNRYDYLFKYINNCIRNKSGIFALEDLQRFKKHLEELKEVRKVYKLRESVTKDIVEVSPLWSSGHHKLEVVENMGAAFDKFLRISEADSPSMLSMIAKYALVSLVASLVIVANIQFAVPIFSIAALVSCFFVASYFALCDYEGYQLRNTYFSEALSAVRAEVVNMLPCYELFFLDGVKHISETQRKIILEIKKEDVAEPDFMTYYDFFSSRNNRSCIASSRQDTHELQFDKVGSDLTTEELEDIQAELDALTDPTQREEMEANLKEAGVVFESKTPSPSIM